MVEPVFLPYDGLPKEWLQQLLHYTSNIQDPPPPAPLWDRGTLSMTVRVGNQVHYISRIDHPYNQLIQESVDGYQRAQTCQSEEQKRAVRDAIWKAIRNREAEAEDVGRNALHVRLVIVSVIFGALIYKRIFRTPLPLIGSTMTPIKWGALIGVGASWEIKPFRTQTSPPRMQKWLPVVAALAHTIATKRGLFGFNSLSTTGLGAFGLFWFITRQLQSAGRQMLNEALLGNTGMDTSHPHRDYQRLCRRLREQSRDLSDQLYNYLSGHSPEDKWRELCNQANSLKEGVPVLAATYAFPFELFRTEVLPVCQRILALDEALTTGAFTENGVQLSLPNRKRLQQGFWQYQQFGRGEEDDWKDLTIAAQKAATDTREVGEVRQLAQFINDKVRSANFEDLPGLKDMRKLSYRILRLRAWTEELRNSLNADHFPPNRSEDATKLFEGEELLTKLRQHALDQEDRAVQEARKGFAIQQEGSIPVPKALRELSQRITKEILTVDQHFQTMAQAWETAISQIAPNHTRPPASDMIAALVNTLIEALNTHSSTTLTISGLEDGDWQQQVSASIPQPVEAGETYLQIRSRLFTAYAAFHNAREQFNTEVRNRYTVYEEQPCTRRGTLDHFYTQAKRLRTDLTAPNSLSRQLIGATEVSDTLYGLQEACELLLSLNQLDTNSLLNANQCMNEKLKPLCEEQAHVAAHVLQAESRLEQKVLAARWVDPFQFELAVILAHFRDQAELLAQLEQLNRGTIDPCLFVDRVFNELHIFRVPDRFYREQSVEIAEEYRRNRFYEMMIRNGEVADSYQTLIWDLYLYYKSHDPEFTMRNRPVDQVLYASGTLDESEDEFEHIF